VGQVGQVRSRVVASGLVRSRVVAFLTPLQSPTLFFLQEQTVPHGLNLPAKPYLQTPNCLHSLQGIPQLFPTPQKQWLKEKEQANLSLHHPTTNPQHMNLKFATLPSLT